MRNINVNKAENIKVYNFRLSDSFTMTYIHKDSVLTITTSLFAGTVEVSYIASLLATGDRTLYSWSLVGSNLLTELSRNLDERLMTRIMILFFLKREVVKLERLWKIT